MIPQLNPSHTTIAQSIEEEDIALQSIHSSLASVTSRQGLFARPPENTHTFLPPSYPVFVSPYARKEGLRKRIEWVVRGEPFEKIEIGSELFGMIRGEGDYASMEIAGEVVGVERFDREHVVFRVDGGPGLEWKVGVRYSFTKVGVWRRIWVFLTSFRDYSPAYGRSRKERWVRYICGPWGRV